MVQVSPKIIETIIQTISMSLGMTHVITITSAYYDGLPSQVKLSSTVGLALPFFIFQLLYESIKYCFFFNSTAPSTFPYLLFPLIAFIFITLETILLDYFFDNIFRFWLEFKFPSLSYSSITTILSFLNIVIQISLVVSFNIWFYNKIVYKNYSGPNIVLSIPFLN